MDLKEVGWNDLDWIYLDMDGDRCRALVNTVMNVRVHKWLGIWQAKRASASQERLIGWLWWGETTSQNCATNGPLFIPRVIGEHGDPWGWWCCMGITPDSSTRALWHFYQQRHLGQVGEMDDGVRILPISNWNTSRDL
jgi:hypothetical protein